VGNSSLKYEWHGTKVIGVVKANMDEHLGNIARAIEQEMTENLEKSGSGKWGPYTRRSVPGQPPAKQSGELYGSIRHKQMSELHWRVGSTSEIAPHMEYGTSPHVIRPKNAKSLHWYDWENEGADVYAKQVHHPGTAPRPFFRPAIDKVVRRGMLPKRALIIMD